MIITIKADPTVIVDVRVKHLAQKSHCRRLVWVALRKVKSQLEKASLPRSILNSLDRCRPSQETRPVRRSDYLFSSLSLDTLEILE
jgi:hypothetical protein